MTFSFAGSSDLVTQLQQGAPGDVFASADTKNMDKATGDNLVEGGPVNFASNTLEIAVPPDNPAKITSFADLAEAGCQGRGLRPAGAVRLGDAEGRDGDRRRRSKPVSEENAVTDVLNKVTSVRPTRAWSTRPTSRAPATRCWACRSPSPARPSTSTRSRS